MHIGDSVNFSGARLTPPTAALTTPRSWSSDELSPYKRPPFETVCLADLAQISGYSNKNGGSIYYDDEVLKDCAISTVSTSSYGNGGFPPVILENQQSLPSSKQFSSSAYSSTQGGSDTRLRTASRKPKRQSHRNIALKSPSIPEIVKQSRKSHNLVEKQYRSRLKNHFESLLAVLLQSRFEDIDDSNSSNHLFSRAEVLDAARQRILSLEREYEVLAENRNQLLSDIALMQEFRRED